MEAKEYLQAAADLILPRECLVCERKLGINEKHLCIECAADLPLTHFETMLHNPMADKFNALIQKDIETQEPFPEEQYASGTALFYYNHDNSYGNIPQALKYDYNIAAGKYFAQILGRKLLESDVFRDVDAVVPVPLHWTRKWKRGYNQAEIIAAELAAILGAPLYPDLLKRIRSTSTQTRLGVEEKHRNVHNAFAINTGILNGFKASHILLIDDVFTTGATLNACRRALRQGLPAPAAGKPPRISVATLAYVGEP